MNLIRLLKKCPRDVPIIITWRDASDDSDDITYSSFKSTKIKEIIYDTIGFNLGVKDGYAVLAYNKEEDGKSYKGVGYIPISLIINVRRLADE